MANCYTAVEQGLEVVPVLNKIDLPTADIDRAKGEIEAVIGIDATDAVAISAKTGMNVPDVLEAIVQRIPPPRPRDTDKLQALIIDSWFDNYLGVVSLVRVMQGEIRKGRQAAGDVDRAHATRSTTSACSRPSARCCRRSRRAKSAGSPPRSRTCTARRSATP